jgi:hypothetical protein
MEKAEQNEGYNDWNHCFSPYHPWYTVTRRRKKPSWNAATALRDCGRHKGTAPAHETLVELKKFV